MRDFETEIRRRLVGVDLDPAVEAEIVEEIANHLEDCYGDVRALHASDGDAVRAVLKELDDEGVLSARVRSAARASAPKPVPLGASSDGKRGGDGLYGWWMDTKFGARLLRRNPVFTAAAVLTIALALGVNTAFFSALRSLILRPLPYPDPAHIAFVHLTQKRTGEARADTMQAMSYPVFSELKASQRVLDEVAGYATQEVGMHVAGEPVRATVELASASYFPLLGIRPVIGRMYTTAEDATPGGNAVLVLSHDLWHSQFHDDRNVIGKTFDLNRVPFTIIGVAPEGFRGLSGQAQAWTPMAMATVLNYPEALQERGNQWINVIGRTRAGWSEAQLAKGLAHTAAQIASMGAPGDQGTASGVLIPLDANRVSPLLRRSVIILFGSAMLVLLIACANIGSLLIARATARQQEIALRLALGAGRARLIRQLIAESLLLATAGGVVGIALGAWGTALLRGITPTLAQSETNPLLSFDATRIDGGVLLFSVIAILATGILAGILPAWRASRPNLSMSLREGSNGSGRGATSVRARGALVVAEAALAVVLLTGAGLLIRTFAHYRATDTGFNADNVLTMRLAPLDAVGTTPESIRAMYRDVADRVATIPGVTAVSVDKCLPLSGTCSSTVATLAGDRTFALDKAPGIGIHFVLPNHLPTLGIPLRSGRMLNATDRDGAPRAVVISESAAKLLFGNANPVGQPITLATAYFKGDAKAEVVGVVGDVRYDEIDKPAGPVVYAPAMQFTYRSMRLLVRTSTDAAAFTTAVRAAVRSAAPDVPIVDVMTMNEHMGDVLARTRLMAVLLAAFAAFALTLAVIGVFGVIGYTVEQRRQEIGVRIALGAQPSRVVRMVARRGIKWIALGTAIGLPVALVGSRMLSGLLYDIAPSDPLTYVVVVTLLLATGAIGAYIPARRASRVDPRDALHAQ